MTHSDLQWLRSEMERVIELNANGTAGPLRADWDDNGFWYIEPLGLTGTALRGDDGDCIESANAKLIVAAVNYSAAWARHVLRVIERAEACPVCSGRGQRPGTPHECSRCSDDRVLLSALIADMRKEAR